MAQTNYLGLKLREPLDYDAYANGSCGWTVNVNFQVIDDVMLDHARRLAALELVAGTLSSGGGSIDAGTF